jgi:endonuclease/exonuclease/phosphatase family metal-dependent hydrolase
MPRHCRTLAILVVALASLVPAVAQAKNAEPTVMTRNVYLGADLNPILAAATSPNPFAVPTAAGQAVGMVFNNDFPARANAIADEIAATQPDLIGLQEVSQYYTGAFNNPAQATTPLLDYMTILQAALAAHGLNYAVVSTPNVESDQEVPAFLGASPATWRDVRLVTSNAILARTDKPELVVSNPQGAAFDVQDAPLGTPSQRNWQTVDVQLGPKDFKFLNTHLEAFAGNEAIRTEQAQELVAGPLQSKKPVIAVGDFNSNPDSATSGAYDVLTSHSGGKLHDAWTATHPGDAGLTCCFPQNLHNAGTFDERLDLVLSGPASVKALSADVIGEDVADRTPGGLAPSDHAGMVATLRVP